MIRPNLFLVLLTMLAVVALIVSIHNEFLLGSTFRACRPRRFRGSPVAAHAILREVRLSPAALPHHIIFEQNNVRRHNTYIWGLALHGEKAGQVVGWDAPRSAAPPSGREQQ